MWRALRGDCHNIVRHAAASEAATAPAMSMAARTSETTPHTSRPPHRFFCGPCFCSIWIYVPHMKLTEIQNLAIQARMALIVGARTFDRLFAGIRFAEADGGLLYVYAKDEETAADIEDDYALDISVVASAILKQRIEVVVVLPKVLQ